MIHRKTNGFIVCRHEDDVMCPLVLSEFLDSNGRKVLSAGEKVTHFKTRPAARAAIKTTKSYVKATGLGDNPFWNNFIIVELV